MRLLISGATGFVGSYLTAYLLKQKVQLGILTRRVPSYLRALTSNIDVYQSEVTKLASLTTSKKYDIFIHLAAANDIDSQDPKRALEVTTLGTKYALDFCRQNQIPRFLYFSTFQVYGRNEGKVNEHTPIRCRNDYALTHWFAEECVRMHKREYGNSYIIARPTNIYGRPFNPEIDRWSLVPNCFCREAFSRQTITLRSSGKQLRDFISLEDVSKITFKLCEQFDDYQNKIVNIARGKSISVLHVARKVKSIYEQLFKKECRLIVQSNQPEKVSDFSVSTDKIKSLKYHYSRKHSIDYEIQEILKQLKKGFKNGPD
jgi:UDP-glucose 4-epimerase